MLSCVQAAAEKETQKPWFWEQVEEHRYVPKIASPEARKLFIVKTLNKRKTYVRTTRVLVAGGGCILLCCPASKRLQKGDPKTLVFGTS